MFLTIHENNDLYRGYLSRGDRLGRWYTNSPSTASTYGIVSHFKTNRDLFILNLGDKKIISFLRNLFCLYVDELKVATINVFDDAIKVKSDGTIERNTSYVADTHILNSLLYSRRKGRLPKIFDGFGADELSTELPGIKHHWEICLFEPYEIRHIHDDFDYDKARIARLLIERKASISKLTRKKKEKPCYDQNDVSRKLCF